MADLRIEQLPTALTLALADLVPLAAYDEQVETGYKASKITAAELAVALLTTFEQSGLSTTSKTIVGAINEIVTSLSSVPEVLTGTADPSSAQGSDKDFYVKYATSGGVTSVTGIFVKLSGAWVSIATGGGAGAFYITMTQSGSSYSVDKTKDEIDGAYADGQALVVIFNVTATQKKYFYLADFSDHTSYKDYYFSYQLGRGAIDFCLTTHSEGVTIQLFHDTPLARIDNTAIETTSTWSSSKIHDEIAEILPTDITATLTAGQTTITFTNSIIGTSGATYDFYTDVLGVNPTAASISGTTLTLTFEAQASDISVKVRITT